MSAPPLKPDEEGTSKEAYQRFLRVLGARVRALRKQRGWSWRDMVVQHDFHLSKWQGYESGKLGVSLTSLLRISQLFGITVSDLLNGLEVEANALLLVPPSDQVGKPPAKKDHKSK